VATETGARVGLPPLVKALASRLPTALEQDTGEDDVEPAAMKKAKEAKEAKEARKSSAAAKRASAASEHLQGVSFASSLRDVRRAPSAVTSSLYVSEIKETGFVVLVSDCHHVLEWPQALLPTDCRQGDVLSFSLRRDVKASTSAGASMDSIQALLLEASGGSRSVL
jgi:hypothetical protein